MSRPGSRKLSLFPIALFLTPLFAGCESAVAPGQAGGPGTYLCKMGPDGECIGTPTLAKRLSFGSPEELHAYLEPLQDASKEALMAAEEGNGFESLRAYLDPNEDTEEAARLNEGTDGATGNEGRALENDGVVREDFPVGDAFLSALNHRGEIQVGGSLFKVTRDYVYEIDPADLALLNEKVPTLSSPAPTDGDPRIQIHVVETSLQRESTAAAAASLAPSSASLSRDHVAGVSGNCYVYAGDRRMHGKSYITNTFFYAEAGVATEWERRKKFLWWTYWSNTWQSGTLSYSFNSNLGFGPWTGPWSPIGLPSGSNAQAGTSSVRKTVAWGVGFGIRIRGSVHTHHTVSNSNVTGSCDTDASA
ncbi:MAG: hypothetical protein AVDCRST_MAG68-4414 [uncultured Gemmatimonadetes bacterium]|uniref:Uncharacterized protein n=1 Tax=uncultured Gemmatimonadota bacterium TaxID=203437 RepID=A0A6J4MBN1_9BACT|nr:MAG: hypothetical protein AVDCRST_MAG68-4414 [uncultured Gemmatimonadota bacterium]